MIHQGLHLSTKKGGEVFEKEVGGGEVWKDNVLPKGVSSGL